MSKIKLKSLSTFLAIIISYMPLYAVGIIQSNDHSFTNNVSVHNFDSFARCPNSIDPETWEKIKNDNTTTFTPEFYQHIYGTPNPSRDLKPFTTWDTICQFCKKEIVPVLALGGLALFGAGVFVYGCLPYYANVGVNAILHGFQQTTAENAANDANAQRERLRLSKRYIYYGPKVWEAIQLKEGGDFVSFDPRIEAHVVIVRESIVDSQSLADASNQPVRNPVTKAMQYPGDGYIFPSKPVAVLPEPFAFWDRIRQQSPEIDKYISYNARSFNALLRRNRQNPQLPQINLNDWESIAMVPGWIIAVPNQLPNGNIVFVHEYFNPTNARHVQCLEDVKLRFHCQAQPAPDYFVSPELRKVLEFRSQIRYLLTKPLPDTFNNQYNPTQSLKQFLESRNERYIYGSPCGDFNHFDFDRKNYEHSTLNPNEYLNLRPKPTKWWNFWKR